MNRNLTTLLTAFLDRVVEEQLLTLSEGLIKVRCAETALSLGWTLQEGAGGAPNERVADYAVLTDGRVRWHRDARRVHLAEGSSDLTIVEPFEMLLEIKARPDYGTKAQAQFQEMDADVVRVVSNRRCAFLFIFDPVMYLSFSGEKRETRGRPAVANEWFLGVFPPYHVVVESDTLEVTVKRDGVLVDMAFRRLPWRGGPHRVVAAGSRQDASF